MAVGSPFRHVLTAALVWAAVTLPVSAQSLIRDADIERTLDDLARPMISGAGLSPSQVKVLVIHDSALNAFVIDGKNIFVTSGLILKLQRAEQLQSVLAHEVAHIANGHIVRRAVNARNANNAAGIGIALAAAAGIASGNGQAAAGLALGSAGAAQRLLLSHTRAEESSADQAGIRYMADAGADPAAMLEVLNIFRGQEALSVLRQDPYVMSHPLWRDRLRSIEGYAAAYKGRAKDNPQANYLFARAQGKLGAFLQNPSTTLRKIKKGDTSDVALMRRAVAEHRKPNPAEAIKLANALVAAAPKDAYYQELRAQILLESGRFPEAVNAYAKAVSLSPKQPLILAGYGRALLAIGTKDGNAKALSVLETARARDPFDPRMLRDLAVAYAKAGQNGMASLVTAERYALNGRLKDASTHATRASGLLPHGSSAWQRAQDMMLTAAEVAKLK
jgi:predicted Zn-dependent protease